MTGSILLDTCAAIWILESAPLADGAVEAMDAAFDARQPTFISPITAWEVGMLAARRRIALALSPQAWFQSALEVPGLSLAPMPPEVLIAASYLPESGLRDPADRILAATARAHGYRLMTRDRPLLAFAEAGHMQAIAC